MRLAIIFNISALLLFTTIDGYKPKWENDFYNDLTNENFREFSLFNSVLDKDKLDSPRLNAAIFYVTNEKRVEHDLLPLKHHPLLERMASGHSRDMALQEFFHHHNDNDKTKQRPKDRAMLVQVQNPYIAENIYYSGGKKFDSYLDMADVVVKALMNSPPHKKNILHESALELGCGIFYQPGTWRDVKSEGREVENFWFATQDFQFYQVVEEASEK